MLVVKFQGGIGNQLFEYAFYKELKYLGKTVYADLSEYRVKHRVRELELSKLGLHVEEAPDTVLRKLGLLHGSVYDKMMFRIKGKKNTVRDEYGQVFNPKFFEEDNALLDGYWQTKKYFSDVFDEVVSEIDFGICLSKLPNSQSSPKQMYSASQWSVTARYVRPRSIAARHISSTLLSASKE